MRANFTVMKDLAQHTRHPPKDKIKMLQDFMTDLNSNPQAQAEMSKWNLAFSSKLLQTQGRTLKTQRKYDIVYSLLMCS